MKNVDIDKLQLLNYTFFEVKKIQDRKNEIESWYHKGFPNYNLIAGLEFPEKHLTGLRNLKNEREKLYSKIEEKSPLVLALLLDAILYYPDIMSGKRLAPCLTIKKQSRDKITTERDYLDSERRQAAKHYNKAVKNIQRAVERENKKLKEKHHSFAINPISVKIHNPFDHIESIKHRPQERGIDLIKTLAEILSPCFETQAERSRIIAEVFQLVYGVPESNIDHRSIAKYC